MGVAAAHDRDLLDALFTGDTSWREALDGDRVLDLWRRSGDYETNAREERVLRSAIWRAAFDDHLADAACPCSLGIRQVGGCLLRRSVAPSRTSRQVSRP